MKNILKNKFFLIGIVAIVLIALGLSVYAPTYQVGQVTQVERPQPTPSPEAGAVQEISVQGGEFYFSPSTPSVNAGRVRITFTNVGSITHNLVITDLGVGTRLLAPGESDSFEVDLSSGTYEFVCTVPGHRERGMIGSLSAL